VDDNVLWWDFSQKGLDTIYKSIKLYGMKETERLLIADGVQISVAKCLIRKVLRERGW